MIATPSGPRRARTRTRPSVRSSVVAGLITVAVVLGIGGYLAFSERTVYTAETSVVVLPTPDLPVGTSASYYETLSDGQIVGTFAEVANNGGFLAAAEDALGLPSGIESELTATVTVVPNTSVLLVTVTAGDPGDAEQVADRMAGSVVDYVAGLNGPYRGEHLSGSGKPAVRTSTPTPILLGLAAVVALIAGIAVQQAVFQLSSLMRSRRFPLRPESNAEPRNPASTDGSRYPEPPR